MAFKTKTDFYGLSGIVGIELTEVSENTTAQTVEAMNKDGFVIASETFAELNAPACNYIIKSRNVTLDDIKLGAITVVDGKSYCLTEVGITTGAGTTPTLNVAGSQVENGASVACTADIGVTSVGGLHHAQTFGAFEIEGAGAHLTECSLNATCTLNTATKDGVPLAHDISDGRVEVTGTIQVSDASYEKPTITVLNGYKITSPLSETNPDSNYPTYTFTLTKYLTGIEPS